MATKKSFTDVFKTITQLLDAVKMLNLHSLVNGTLLGLTTAIEELTKKVKKRSDPKIDFEIEDLRQKLGELKILITEGFVPACESVAKFASKPERLKRIRADLQAGRTGKLQEFLDTLGKRFDYCKECADTFTAEYEALKKRVKDAIHTHGEAEGSLKQDEESKELYYKGAVATGGMAVTAGILAAASGGVGLIAGSAAYLIFSGGLLGGVAATGVASGICVALKFTQEDYELMVSVTERINKMFVEMGDLHNKFDRIQRALTKTKRALSTVLEEGQSIKEPESDVDDIMEALEELGENMGRVLERAN